MTPALEVLLGSIVGTTLAVVYLRWLRMHVDASVRSERASTLVVGGFLRVILIASGLVATAWLGRWALSTAIVTFAVVRVFAVRRWS